MRAVSVTEFVSLSVRLLRPKGAFVAFIFFLQGSDLETGSSQTFLYEQELLQTLLIMSFWFIGSYLYELPSYPTGCREHNRFMHVASFHLRVRSSCFKTNKWPDNSIVREKAIKCPQGPYWLQYMDHCGTRHCRNCRASRAVIAQWAPLAAFDAFDLICTHQSD